MSSEGASFLASRGRAAGNSLAMLDMLGRQAPAPDSQTIQPPPDLAHMVPQQAVTQGHVAHRVVISYGRGEDNYVVALEQAPDWDMVGTWYVSNYTAQHLSQIIRAMLGDKGLKDYTGEFHAVGPKVVPRDTPYAATDPRPAREPTARQRAYYSRGRKDRADDPAVVQRRGPHGPRSSGQGGQVVRGTEASVQEAVEPGGE